MLTGYNTDFKFKGKIYHCQTEDGGVNNPSVTSLLYLQGAILASRKTSYADILKADCLDEVVRDLMMEQHKKMIRELIKGELNLDNAPHESTYTSSTESGPAPTSSATTEEQPVPSSSPSAEPVKVKNLDEIILDFLAQEQHDREQK